jgi:hypothetical protein
MRDRLELAEMRHGLWQFFFASAYWALRPLVAHDHIAGGPELYGILLGAIGTGAFALPWIKAILGPDRLVAAGTLGTALSLLPLGFARNSAPGLAAYMIAGISSIAVLASLNVSVQVSLPDADIVRGGFHFISTRDVFP